MKKVLSFVLCVIMVFAFTGCGETNSKELPDFADCKIGYQLVVYPKVAFSYIAKPNVNNTLTENCIVHIGKITATLTEKNTINEGDILTEYFFPFTIELKITGHTDVALAGKKVIVGTTLSARAIGTIDEDGSYIIQQTINEKRENLVVCFTHVEILG